MERHNFLPQFAELTDKYRVTGAMLGEGIGGQVFPGIRVSDKFAVAIKRIVDWNMPQEVQILELLSGVRDVIRLLDVFGKAEGNVWFVVMERPVSSSDLFNWVSHMRYTSIGHVPEDVGRRIWKRLLEIWLDCAREGVCHVDLHSHNVLVNHRSILDSHKPIQVTVIDFGKCKLIPYHSPKRCAECQFGICLSDVYSRVNEKFSEVLGTMFYGSSVREGVSYKFRGGLSDECVKTILLLNESPNPLTVEDLLNLPWTNSGV